MKKLFRLFLMGMGIIVLSLNLVACDDAEPEVETPSTTEAVTESTAVATEIPTVQETEATELSTIEEETESIPEPVEQANNAPVTGDLTIEFDDIIVSLNEPIIMTGDEFRSEFPDWSFDLGSQDRWLVVYAQITNHTHQEINFGNRPFYITDEFEDLQWQSTAIDRLNGTGFDVDGIIAPGETLSGYVPFTVTRHSSTFEIDVRPLFVDQLGSPFAGRFVFNLTVEMD